MQFFLFGTDMLIKSRPSTARCNEELYTSYLLSDPRHTSCTRLAEAMGNISHDSINRFLERERFEPADLFEQAKNKIDLTHGILSVDDSVLDKPYMNSNNVSLVDHFWSGKHKQVVKGINLITLFYTDIKGVSVPVNYRVYDKAIKKTKNDYFREMLCEVISWGLEPSWVTGDSWYSSVGNMKFIRKLGLNFMFGIENNRTISIERGQYTQIQKLEDWMDDEQTVYLKDYGMVKVFRQIYKKSYRYYIMSHAKLDLLPDIKKSDFESVHAAHWGIELYHRALKQVCNIENFQVRGINQIKNHLFCALKAFVRLEFMRFDKTITNWYEIQRNLFLGTIRDFIKGDANCNMVVNA
jgi:hypothetical protein